ncbi:MAG: FAD-dependent oxidoreductase [Thermodesulfobacteriota bacterium]|nr:FAD-dependent oxidoreductase [Thermodesulfobacteriota bacterium]
MNNFTHKSRHIKAPCVMACPAHIDIPRYARLIAHSKFDEALAVIREKIPFPSVCGRVCHSPCELTCNVNRMYPDEPVMIRMLKRFVADMDKGEWKSSLKTSKTIDTRIAIIGAGPAGLTAAYFLALKGYKVIVFEALQVAGGVLAMGIPEYKLPKSILNSEIQLIKDLGVTIKTNTPIGKDLTLKGIKDQGYRVILIAIGAHLSSILNIKGQDLNGVMHGIEFLRRVNSGEKPFLGEKVVVISGDRQIWRSYTAIDSARTALRTGAKEVYLLCLHPEKNIPAIYRDEIEKGIQIQYAVSPVRISGKDGKVNGVECVETGGEVGHNFTIEVDTVIVAVDRLPDLSLLTEECTDWISITEHGFINTDKEGFANNELGIFAAGNVVGGSSSVIESIASGRKAASSIDKYLEGDGIIDKKLSLSDKGYAIRHLTVIGDRAEISRIPIEERLSGFQEVEMGLNEDEAIKQANRCLRCDLPIMASPAKCYGCLMCMMRCSLAYEKAFNPSKARIKIERLVDTDIEYMISFTDKCNNCGICVVSCPYDALIRENREVI